MKHSLRVKNTVILILLLILFIGVSWLLNEFFLDDYYLAKKINILSNSYSLVNEYIYKENPENRIERIEAADSVSVYILAEAESTIFGDKVLKFVYPIDAEMGGSGNGNMIKHNSFQSIIRSLKIYIFDNTGRDKESSPEHLDSLEDKFDIYKLYDYEVDSYYIDLIGYLDNGYMIFIRSSYENIEESADIASRFMAIVGIALIVLGSIVMFVVSKSFTKPILELATISDRMSALDFDSKYTGRRKDEIGKLGASMNKMSDKLESTITELKTANIELERDIANKIQIDEMRKEFLSNVSHELKTPIALIQGYAEGLQDNVGGSDPESQNYYCDVIIDEARKMNDMVKKLTSLNEIEFGTNKIDMSRFDIVELARSVAASFDILVKSKDIQIIFNEHEPVFVWADEYSIEEVITNYLSNAINHANGRKIIDISFRETEDNRIRVSVFNTGDNIPEEELDNIWIKFYKVDKARTREYGGNGIGLSIVKAIMEQHNQSCGVKNHFAGVEFWFELDMKSDE